MFEQITNDLLGSRIELTRAATAYLDYGVVHAIVSVINQGDNKRVLTLEEIIHRARSPIEDLESANINFSEKPTDDDVDTLILTVGNQRSVEPEAREFLNRLVVGAAEGVLMRAAELRSRSMTSAVGASAGGEAVAIETPAMSYITPDNLETACQQLFLKSTSKWFLC